MRRSTSILILLLVATVSFAQFDPQVGLYMFLPTTFNPASAGENDLLRATASHRMDFVGVSNAPMTTYVTFSSPFKIKKTKHAAGVRFLNDRAGLWTNQALHAQYAYKHAIGKGTLSVGVELGFLNVGFRGDSVNISQIASAFGGNEGYFQDNDQYIPTKAVSGMGFDMGVGVWYTATNWYAGLNYTHLTQPKISWMYSDNKEYKTKAVGALFLVGGYNYRFKRAKQWQLKPSMMVMTDFRNWDINMTMLADYKDKYRFGLGYRLLGSVNLLASIEIFSGFQIGYTWEIQTSKLMTEGYGSHEIYIAYGFNILQQKRTNKYKSIRYL